MKIFLICEGTDGLGGWVTYTRTLAEALRTNNHNVRTVTAIGGDYAVLPGALQPLTRPWKAAFAAGKLRKILEREQPDILHVTLEIYLLLIPFLPSKWQRRTVITFHGSYAVRIPSFAWLRPLFHRALRAVPAIIIVSDYTKGRLLETIRKYGWTELAEEVAQKSHVILNGINLPPPSPPHQPSDVSQILLVGGVKPRKAVLQALRACAAYRKVSTKPFHFSVVGAIDERSEYVARVRKEIDILGLQDCVTLTGRVADAELATLYAKADLYLMPSPTAPNTFEGYGLVFVEAAARGIASIGPNDSGAAEAIAEGKSGYRVDPENPDQIAERMQWILDEHRINPTECRAWAEAHDITPRAREIEHLYADILRSAS